MFNLLVCSYYNNSILRYDGTTGAFRGAFVPQGYGDLEGPHGLALARNGNLLVASGPTSSILRYDQTTGEFLDFFVSSGNGGLDGAAAAVLGPDGNLYVSSATTRSVLRYHGVTGAFLDPFVPGGSGGLHRPHGLAFGPDGHLYVNSADDDSVRRYDGSTGVPLPAPGRTGATFVAPHSGRLTSPWGGLAFAADGHLCVSSWGTNSVLRYDRATGDFLGAFVPGGSGGLMGPHGLGFGPDGHLYVVSQTTNNILRYDGRTGDFLDTFVPNIGHLVGPTTLFFWDTTNANTLPGTERCRTTWPGAATEESCGSLAPGSQGMSSWDVEQDRQRQARELAAESGEEWLEEYRELLDRATLIAGMVEQRVLGHPACAARPDWYLLAEQATAALRTLQRQVGAENLAGENWSAELAGLQGTWNIQALQENGQEEPPEKVKAGQLVIEKDKVIFKRNGEMIAKGIVALDPTKSPKHLDFRWTCGQTDVAIYFRLGDYLIQCGHRDGQTRPEVFASGTADGGAYLALYQREK